MPRSRSARAHGALEDSLPAALTAPTSGITRIAPEANTPTLGTPSLRVGANIALSATSALFKNNVVFLGDDTTGNTALGREALASVSGNASNNTGFGRRALEDTTGGVTSDLGSYNTAIGDGALRKNSIGYSNTATGYAALTSNTQGRRNTATGHQALYLNTTGSRNTAIGDGALVLNTNGNLNTASGDLALRSNTSGSSNTASGSRALYSNNYGDFNTSIGTQDIQDLGPLADRLLELRPVAFRYRQHAATDPDTPLQFGLIAEEVAEVLPELVVYDASGKPETIKYHLLSSLLLGEVQRLHARLEAVESEGRSPGRRDGDRRRRGR